MDKFEILKQIFGYDTFREGQEELVDSSLSGRDVLGIMPTGAGSLSASRFRLFYFRNYYCSISPDLSYEGPGVRFKCGRGPCGLHKQFSHRRPVQESHGAGTAGKI